MKYWTAKSGVEIYRVLQGRCNCYLVSKGDRFLLIDSGGSGSWNALKEGLGSFEIKKGSPISLILTHCHYDHAENAARFRNTYKAPIIVHRNEKDYLKSGENPPIKGTVFFTKTMIGLLSGMNMLDRLRYEPCGYDVVVDEHLGLESLGFPGCILHTPGHSPGSISVIIDDELAIVGDAMFGIFPWSAFPPFAGDVKSMIASWKKLLDRDCRIYLPAHGSERSRDLLKRQYDKYKRIYAV
ncbi:MAG: MBL fold metallo-hydrolase [Syntrophales bacterium]|jgi:glyoxylase-like metal-dependent hydrolase (beta-lactamase superfamily II)|nr:MBL fold metallo-hydrolase [Syntrophales bacterium]